MIWGDGGGITSQLMICQTHTLSTMSTSPHLAITFQVTTRDNGHSLCEMAIANNGQATKNQQFQGQSHNHAIAIALENLASHYHQAADAEQTDDWIAVEHSPDGEVITKRYHVVLHYERVVEDESKFEAMNNTIMGNTVMENALITVMEVDQDLPVETVARADW
jgi:hypothetical protein